MAHSHKPERCEPAIFTAVQCKLKVKPVVFFFNTCFFSVYMMKLIHVFINVFHKYSGRLDTSALPQVKAVRSSFVDLLFSLPVCRPDVSVLCEMNNVLVNLAAWQPA